MIADVFLRGMKMATPVAKTLYRSRRREKERMGDFPIIRPEGIAPANSTRDQDSARGESRRERRPRPAPHPPTPELPADSPDDDPTHQVDELA
jgi:hypothetical protein